MLHLECKDLSVIENHRLLLGGVGPRPIALVSTLSKDGINNLSPFSFFNAFGANPPMVAFSPARRGRDGTLKDTYNNLKDTGECVIHSVTYNMVQQINIASTEWPSEVDEFVKSGFTPIDSDIVKPKRVKESPFQMECILRDLKSYGDKGSSANIAICEIVKWHIDEDLFVNGFIHPDKIDLVSRMSADFYCRASGENIFELRKPVTKIGIGFESLPEWLTKSFILNKNDLGKLANTEVLPDKEQVLEFKTTINNSEVKEFEFSEEAFYRYLRNKNYSNMLRYLLSSEELDANKFNHFLELTIKSALDKNDIENAWKIFLMFKQL